jgi:EF-P beta-lysylation protein EpmB
VAQIIQKKRLSVEHNWQKELALSFSDPKSLLNYLELDPQAFTQDIAARKLFPMRVPRFFASLMNPQDPLDPLLRQVLPKEDEFASPAGYSKDPLLEHDTAGKGLLHKYQNRVLLIVRGGCAVNCRYCFRRHFPYGENALNKAQLQESLDYIAAHPQINEVILSGGDPLMANDDHLAWLAERIASLPQIIRLRIHTRLPVVLPQRIDSHFMAWISDLPLQVIIVLHINHGNEVSDELKEKCQQLKQSGITLLNQAVLLKGINDTADALVNLHDAIFDAGILPYYLHLLDKVQGAAHFNIDTHKARQLMAEVIRRQPGYLVPKLVTEIGGQPSKTPVDLQLHP